MIKEEIKEIKEQLYYLDSELYSYQDIDNLKEYAKNLEKENQQLKKKIDDVVELIKARIKENEGHINVRMEIYHYKNMLRMLGETDE